MGVTQELLDFVWERYSKKFPNKTGVDFHNDWEKYESIPAFGANENIYHAMTNYNNRDELADIEEEEVKPSFTLTPEVHWILRITTQYYLTKAFEAMKIDMTDPNIKENAVGKSTPGRISKCWVGKDPEDDSELGSGRFMVEPYISCFPNNDNDKSIITKKVDIVSNCSHHFLPFSSFDGGKAIISYIPNEYVIGISKLQRWVDFIARRFWLQEDLTKFLGGEIKRIAGTEDVYIRLEGLVHGCEKFRGCRAKEGSLTTEFKSGYFKEHNV